jgi:hypothetical protein
MLPGKTNRIKGESIPYCMGFMKNDVEGRQL